MILKIKNFNDINTNVEYKNIFNSNKTVEYIGNILTNEKNANVLMFVSREKFKKKSGLYYIYNLIKEYDIDIINISLLETKDKKDVNLDNGFIDTLKEIDPLKDSYIKKSFIDPLKHFLSKDWDLICRKMEPISYEDKDNFMKKYYKLLYE